MNNVVYDERGNAYTLSEYLGQGGQGVVYRVNRSTGRGLAVKGLLDPATGGLCQDGKRYKQYVRTVHRVMALPELDHLAMPLALLREPCCGYIMRLMEGMCPLENWLRPRSGLKLMEALADGGGLEKRLVILRNLARVLSNLHNQGIVYGDLSPGNVFAAAKENEQAVWLIDLDNMAYADDVHSSVGTPCYRSPEVALGRRNTMMSDCYSFALLAYECLTFSKPFNGTLVDQAAEEEDFGDSIYDQIERGEVPYVYESGGGNEARYGLSTRPELVMTPEMAELFAETFSQQGRQDPGCRPSMRTWLRALNWALDSTVCCGQGHSHLGTVCPFCEDRERKQNRYYQLRACRLEYVLTSPEDPEEDCERGEYSVLRVPVYEKRQNRQLKQSVLVPWRALGPDVGGHPPEDRAFELCFLKQGCKVEHIYDPKLRVEPKFGGPPGVLWFTARYLNAEVELEIKEIAEGDTHAVF